MTDEERTPQDQPNQATPFTAEQSERIFRELIRHHAAGALQLDTSQWEIQETPAHKEALKRNEETRKE